MGVPAQNEQLFTPLIYLPPPPLKPGPPPPLKWAAGIGPTWSVGLITWAPHVTRPM